MTHQLSLARLSHQALSAARLLIVAAAIIGSGCGQKGALYLNEEDTGNTRYVLYPSVLSDAQADNDTKNRDDPNVPASSSDSQDY